MPKLTQQQANYRRGSPVKHCGNCVNFQKKSGMAAGSCSKVAGTISPYGVSNAFAMTKNPFGPMLGRQETAIIDEMAQSAPDRSRFVPMMGQGQMSAMGDPALRIGGKRY